MSNVGYQGHDRRRGNQVLEGRIEDLEADVLALKTNVDGMKHKADQVETAIQQNTALTAEVKADTRDIVNLLKGVKVLGWMMAWTGGIAVAWGQIKGWKW